MKKIYRIILLGAIALAAANQSEAQAHRKLTQADAAKLPSHRPMPDIEAMKQKYAKMRADAKKQQVLEKQHNDQRQNRQDRQPISNRQPVVVPVKQ